MSRCYRIALVLLSLALLVLSAGGTDPIQVLLASILGGWVVLFLGSWMWIERLREAAAGRPRRPLGRETAAAAVALLLIASIATTHWPLRLAFSLFRSDFDRLADRVEQGDPLRLPERVGWFVIRQAGVNRAGVTCLWSSLDPDGNGGFVRCPAGDVRTKVNLWSMRQVGDNWHLVFED
jgi:hypothetical protein